DRVIMKGDGTTTYLIPDLAYHISKYKRGFNQLIDILGPDHHGHTKKLQAGMKILGYDIDILNFIILQQVNFIIGDKKVKMSKREGNIFTLDQLIDEVGTDASRFFFLMRKSNSPLDFDIELAKKQSSENPVYYVQYAHARINSLEKKVSKEGIKFKNFKPEYLKRLRYEEEWNLIRKLMKFPELLVHISATQSVHLLTSYLIGLASTYHTFYQKRRVVNKRYKELSLARLYLCKATQIVLANGLRLLGISAPKEM
ncbi:MAG: arginine--tRNA ligase, partial [Candidatus Cloacimonetes bacterium]|nr:arginine--tRNA ligase [Candidatus Cloacimonadota bacterium]